METRNVPTSFIYENISYIKHVTEHTHYRVYKLTALHKKKYINMPLKAIVFNSDISDLFVLKYNLMLKTLGQIPKEFILANNKVFNSQSLIKETKPQRMIICKLNEKTLNDYLKETIEFLQSNKDNKKHVLKNINRVEKLCIEAIRALHKAGFCYDKIHIEMFQGNHNLSEIYLQYFENMIVCDDPKHKRKNIDELKEIFARYK